MAKAKRLKPRKRWTNRLAWSVWKIARNNKVRAGAVVKEVCRWFSNFNGTSSYAEMTDDIVLAGDFEIEIDFFVESQSTSNQSIFSDSTSAFYITVGANSNNLIVQMPTSASNAYIILSGITFGQRKKLILARSGNTFNLSIDGLSQSQNIANALPSLKINEIAARGGSNFMAGQLSNLQIWDGGDSTTGTKIMNMAMDERYLNVHGEILYNNSAVVDDWYLSLMGGAYISDGTITLSGDFEIEAVFKTSQTASDYAIFDSATFNSAVVPAGSAFMYVDNPDGLELIVGDGAGGFAREIFGGQLLISNDIKNIVTLKRIGNQLTATLNGSPLGIAQTMTTNDIYFDDGLLFGGSGREMTGDVFSVELWDNGNRTTGTKVLDYKFDSLSNIIANAASAVNANVWGVGNAITSGDVTIISSSSVRLNRPTGAGLVEINYGSGLRGVDFLVEVSTDGDINKVIAGENTAQMSGWVDVVDSNGQPTGRFKTLSNNTGSNNLLLKCFSDTDITLTDISFVEVEGYGVLQGTRGTDYNWTNETPHAIGHNITTTEDPDCPLSDLFAGGVLQSNGTLQDGTILGQP